MSKKIAIIGGGNLGASIADGLIASEFSRPVELTITRRNISLLSRFAEQGSMVHSDNVRAVKDSEVIILAVKPYNFQEIVQEIRPALNPKNTLSSQLSPVFGLSNFRRRLKKKYPLSALCQIPRSRSNKA